MTVRERLIPWAGQPAGAVRAHPKWGDRLRFLSVGAQLRNLGAHPAGQSVEAAQQGAPAQFGAGFATTGANHQMLGSGPGALTSSVREVFVAQFRIDALPAGTAHLFGTCTNFTSNPSLHSLYLNASGQIGIAHRAGGSSLVAVSASRTHSAGSVVTAVGVSTATNSRRIYLATGESASSSSTSSATNPAHYFAGGHAYSGNYPLLTIGLLAHIDGVPADEDEFVRKLLANPYGELVEPRRIWIPVSSGTSHTLTGANAAQAATSSTGAAGQVHALAGAAATQAATSAAGAVAQAHTLASANSAQPAAAGTGAVTQVHALAAANATQANACTADALPAGSSHTLAGSTSAQPATSAAGAVSQVHQLAGSSCSSAASSTAGAVAQVHALAGASAAQASASGTGAASQAHALAAASSTQAASSTAAALGGAVGPYVPALLRFVSESRAALFASPSRAAAFASPSRAASFTSPSRAASFRSPARANT